MESVLVISLNSRSQHEHVMEPNGSRNAVSGLFLVAVISILAVVLGALVVALPMQTSPGTATNTQTTTDNSRGIALVLTVNPQNGPSGSVFQINGTVANILQRANNVTGIDNYRGIGGNPVCNTGPLAFEVLQGYYTSSDYASGKVVNIHGVQNYMCVIGASNLRYYVFQSKGDVFKGPASGGVSLTRAAHFSVDVTQQWSQDLSGRGPLSSGTYTVVAADNWGQIAVVHFTVS
jgi:hypothetical protein